MNKVLAFIATVVMTSAMLIMPVQAEPSQASSTAEATAIAVDKCKNGCTILSPEDVKELEGTVNSFAQSAFQAGANEALEMVQKNLGPICKQYEKNRI